MPLLRRRLPRSQGDPGTDGGTACASSTATFPITSSHPHAEKAAEAAEAVSAQGPFLGNARPSVRAPGAADGRTSPRLYPSPGPGPQALRPGSCRQRVRTEGSGRLHDRRAERRERSANFYPLYQRCALRRLTPTLLRLPGGAAPTPKTLLSGRT